jgi:hypothetical protein
MGVATARLGIRRPSATSTTAIRKVRFTSQVDGNAARCDRPALRTSRDQTFNRAYLSLLRAQGVPLAPPEPSLRGAFFVLALKELGRVGERRDDGGPSGGIQMSDWRIRHKDADGRETNRFMLVGAGAAVGP